LRDRLDGITTKEGRVVYDRDKHLFNDKDVLRIIKKVNSLEDPRDGVFSCDMIAEYLLNLVKRTEVILRKASAGGCETAIEDTLSYMAVLVKAMADDFEYGGGTAGGGGATRIDF